MELASAGKKEEAQALFEQLEIDALSTEEKAQVRIMRLSSEKEAGVDLLEKIESIDEAYRDTAVYHFWIGILEPRSAMSVKELAIASERSGASIRGAALIELARRQSRSGQADAAADTLIRGLRDDLRALRADAAAAWCELRDDDPAIVKFLIIHIGIRARNDARLMRLAAELALSEGWLAVALRLAQAFDAISDSGESANTLGRTYDRLGMYSLAYRAYAKAANAGIAVAKANMANLFLRANVAAAGLKLLDDHAGSIESASPSYPHRIRALLEESLEQEQAADKSLEMLGKHVRMLLGDFGDLVIGTLSEASPGSAYRRESVLYEVSVTANGLILKTSTEGARGFELRHFPAKLPAWSAWAMNKCIGLFSIDGKGNLRGVTFDLETKGSSAELAVFELVTEIATTNDEHDG